MSRALSTVSSRVRPPRRSNDLKIDCANGIDAALKKNKKRGPFAQADVLRLVERLRGISRSSGDCRDHTDDAELRAGTLHQINELLVGGQGAPRGGPSNHLSSTLIID